MDIIKTPPHTFGGSRELTPKESEIINKFINGEILTWKKTSEELPILNRNYWLSDGKKLALGTWNIKDMCWQFLWLKELFDVKYFMEVKLPQPPEKL